MNTKTDFFEDRLRVFLEQLSALCTAERREIGGFKYKYCGYKSGNALPHVDSTFKTLEKGEYWGNAAHIHAWFYKKLEIPAEMQGKNLVLRIETQKDGWNVYNPQFIAYVNGILCQGLDTNHRELYLDSAENEYEIYIYAYTSNCSDPLEFNVSLIEYDAEVKKLYTELSIILETLSIYQPEEKIYADIKKYAADAINLVDIRSGRCADFYDSVRTALKYLDKNLIGKNKSSLSAVCIGHTHIDVAWLWTLAQTREKVLRSFSNVVTLMKKYPEYKFMSSQAQLYKFLKEESPELYEEVKQLIRQGRWEVEGAMWVEADCNLSSGESLVRQILYGKKFFKNEFGVDCHVLWLPDVFGYSAALPQILKKSGIDKFVTSKISWNETNTMPYDMFFWHGIDGTDVFTYFLTAQEKKRGEAFKTGCGYNAILDPSNLIGAYERFQQKELTDEVMITYGFGDGGGGPTEKHLEYYDILKKGFPGIPKAKSEFAGEFLERLKKSAEKQKNTPHWYGELYLEYHRGTYTSMAINKRYNRKSEFLLEKAETLSVIAERLADISYPADAINNAWETVLLNQFHDIIPGSSIKEVYDVSRQQYEEVAACGNSITEQALDAIAKKIDTNGGVLVFNNNSFTAGGTVKLDGKTIFVKNIPAKGYRVVQEYNEKNSIKVGENTLENKFFKLAFDKKGAFTKIYDKKNKRDILIPGRRGNVLMAYEDLPQAYDNWELSNYYTEKSWEIDGVVSVNPVSDGARAGLCITKRFLSSTLVQTIWIYEDIARIDFENDFDWKEKHLVVKAEFPVNINSQTATYDIQFGSVERPTHMNTSWDKAKFEVCAHKYADFSEYGYGVSLLNDCKYGYDIHGGVMKLTLLKCGTHPNPDADKCRHEFTYSLYPHADDYRAAGTIRQSYLLNIPMTAKKLEKQKGNLPDSYSAVSCPQNNIFIETVKKSEDGNGIIIRLYEAFNRRTCAELETGFEFKNAYICDMCENIVGEASHINKTISLSVSPFEIITIKLV